MSRRTDALKLLFWAYLGQTFPGKFTREVYFDKIGRPKGKGRNWRFDFACLEHMIAIELEGTSRYISRHQTLAGYRGDCFKYNAATVRGWRILRFTYEMLESGQGVYDSVELMMKKFS